MKKILLGATAALLITGCAQNELLDGGISTPNDGKIYFSATSGVPTNTRAATGNPINSTADLQGRPGAWGKFHVQGYVDGAGAAYVNADPTFNGTSWEYKDEPYWPNATMDFYAHANWATAPSIDPDPAKGITATDITIAADQLNDNGQKDLLVAGTFDASKEIRTLLTFKHALTQIVFKAGNINPSKITAKIGGVKIVNVGSMGDMAFTKNAPAVKWSKPTTIDAATSIEPNGATAAPAARRASYEVQGINNTVDNGFLAPDLSATPNDYSKYPRIQTAEETDNNALMLLPQNFNAWNTNDGKKVEATDEYGAYIEIDALVYEAGKLATDANVNKYVYAGSSNGTVFSYGKIYIPVSSLENEIGQWVPGKRINYIITFGDSNSGSGGAGYDENGDPILVPIRFRAVVEDWVETDVPLLTATFEATSQNITHKFIDGYTNQLLNDIKAAPAPKVYTAEIKLKGTLSANIGETAAPVSDFLNSNIITDVITGTGNVNFQSLLAGDGSFTFQNAKIRPGSTLVYNFTEVTNLNQTKKAIIEVPNGWTGQSMTGATLGTIVAAGGKITLDGTINGVKLTKIATNAHTLYGAAWVATNTNGYSYECQAGYIEDNLAAVELNENYAATPNKFTNTIKVNNPMPSKPKAYFFSSDMLAKFENTAFDNSTVIIDMSTVTIPEVDAPADLRSIQTVVPKGWTITKNGTVYYPGDLVAINGGATDATNAGANAITKSATAEYTWTYTKQLGTPGAHGNWKNELELAYWLTQTKTAGVNDVFYYDNTDGLITINLDATVLYAGGKKWADMVGSGTIYFKNNVGAVKIAAAATTTGEWTWTNVGRKLEYNSTKTSQAAINVVYNTKAVALAQATASHITGAAPAAWDHTWIPSTNVATLTLTFSEPKAGTAPTDANGWVYTAATQTAVFTKTSATNVADNTALKTAVSAATAGNIIYYDALDFDSVVANAALTAGQKVYVVVNGTATNLPTGWVQAGNVVTFTK